MLKTPAIIKERIKFTKMYTRATLWKTINFILPVIILVTLFRAASLTATTRLMFYQAFMAEMFANS